MASSQAILSALSNMQADTQAALPVIPNNGNPGGVYNQAAPQPVAPPQQQQPNSLYAPRQQSYEWLKPSPYMEQVNQYLSQRPQFKSASAAAIQTPAAAQAPTSVPSVGLPQLPQRIG